MDGAYSAPGSAPPHRLGQKRPAAQDDDGDEYDHGPQDHLDFQGPPHFHGVPRARQPSSTLGSSYGDVKDEDGDGSASGGSKRPKTGPPPLKRGSACSLCRKRKLVRPRSLVLRRLEREKADALTSPCSAATA